MNALTSTNVKSGGFKVFEQSIASISLDIFPREVRGSILRAFWTIEEKEKRTNMAIKKIKQPDEASSLYCK